MPHYPSDPNRGALLRFVFGDAELRFHLGAGATLEDVALKLGDPVVRGHGRLVAVLVAVTGSRRQEA